jgi:hypothetical protein
MTWCVCVSECVLSVSETRSCGSVSACLHPCKGETHTHRHAPHQQLGGGLDAARLLDWPYTCVETVA